MPRDLAVREWWPHLFGNSILLEPIPPPPNLFVGNTEEADMPAIIIPVLWVGGAAILLGGGWYVIGHMVH
jgi:hypothetical protein